MSLTADESLEILQLVARADNCATAVTSVMLMVTREAKPDVLDSALVRQVVPRTSHGWRIASREILGA